MSNHAKIVINTSPLIARVAAWGSLARLESLYSELLVPYEVAQELLQGGKSNFAVNEF